MTRSKIYLLSGAALGFLSMISSATAGEVDWLSKANERIEQHRKAPLQVTLQNKQGRPVKGANIQVSMTRHAFEFGSAVKVAAINDPEREAYRQKFLELFHSALLLLLDFRSGVFGKEPYLRRPSPCTELTGPKNRMAQPTTT